MPELRGGPTAQIDFWQKLKSLPFFFCHQGTEVEVVYKWCEAHKTNESRPVTKWKTIRQREAGATGWWAVARTFSQSDRSISLEGQLLQLHLFPSSREVHKRHIESSWDNLNSPSLSCLIAHFPGDSYYFTSGEIHKRTTVRSTKTKSFVLKMDKAQKKGAKFRK